MPIYPDELHSPLISRTASGVAAHEWTGNEDRVGHHHGTLDLNESPCYLALYWQSHRVGRTVHVGTYKLSLHRLVGEGLARMEGAKKVRLRFAREDDGTIVIQLDQSGPRVPIGMAVFD